MIMGLGNGPKSTSRLIVASKGTKGKWYLDGLSDQSSDIGWYGQGIGECDAKDLHLKYALGRSDFDNWFMVSRELGSVNNNVMRLGIVECRVILRCPFEDSLEFCFNSICIQCIDGWNTEITKSMSSVYLRRKLFIMCALRSEILMTKLVSTVSLPWTKLVSHGYY